MEGRDKLHTVTIKDKEYVQVNERIRYFREQARFKDYRLISNILDLDDTKVIIKAEIYDGDDRLVATGLARELKDGSFINKTSYIENCETSAWGRALANLGIGVYGSIASAEEVVNAINNQSTDEDVSNLDSRSEAEKDTTSDNYVFIKSKFRGMKISDVNQDELLSYYDKYIDGKNLKSDDWLETKAAIEHAFLRWDI